MPGDDPSDSPSGDTPLPLAETVGGFDRLEVMEARPSMQAVVLAVCAR